MIYKILIQNSFLPYALCLFWAIFDIIRLKIRIKSIRHKKFLCLYAYPCAYAFCLTFII